MVTFVYFWSDESFWRKLLEHSLKLNTIAMLDVEMLLLSKTCNTHYRNNVLKTVRLRNTGLKGVGKNGAGVTK